jgi:hypothetical protein
MKAKFISMKKFFFIVIIVSLFYSCKEEELSDIKPVITIEAGTNLVSESTTLPAGQQYQVHIVASAENGENLTNLIIKSNGARVFDNGYNAPTLSETITLTKTTEETEVLTFIIRNKARLADSVSITLTKEIKEPGEIIRYNTITIGCHQNTSIGNYYSLSSNLIYTQTEAYTNQNLIDIIYFFDAAEDQNALGSPAANLSSIITGSEAPENWTIKRTTRYTRSAIDISDADFNNSTDDSLILANLFTDGGRKAKQLQAGQYFGFVNEEGKYGILKIENVTGQVEGTLQFSLIIQK